MTFATSVRRHPWRTAGVFVLLLVLGVAYIVAFQLDEPIRREMEQRLNAKLEGYKVQVGGADFHPLGLSLDLEDLLVVQEAAPDPPVAKIDEIQASVQWGALLSGAIVADMEVVRPQLHLTRTQAQREASDGKDIEERGWQEAVQEIYPLEINEFRITDGDITYVDPGPYDPVHVEDLSFVARNIRNVRDSEVDFPSPIEVEAKLFGDAQLDAEGAADFLAEPSPKVRFDEFELDGVDIARMRPILREVGLDVRQGTLGLVGHGQYTAEQTKLELEKVTLKDAVIDYRQNGNQSVDAVEKTAEVAGEPKKAPPVELQVDRLQVSNSELGLINETADPTYRLFLANLALTVDNFSNRKGAKPGHADLKARFMNSGNTHVEVDFHPGAKQADFNVDLEIGQTDLQTMNNLWRAYGSFDFADGAFAFYSSLRVKDGRVDGYVKPLFTDLDVLDAEQDADDNIFEKAYEGIVGGIAKVLENRSREQVATETDLSGPLENPNASVLQVIVGLVRNAFFDAILPGLKKSANA